VSVRLDRTAKALTHRLPDRVAPELIPPVLVVTTKIEASKQQAAWSAVDGHILPHHTVSFTARFTASKGRAHIWNAGHRNRLWCVYCIG